MTREPPRLLLVMQTPDASAAAGEPSSYPT